MQISFHTKSAGEVQFSINNLEINEWGLFEPGAQEPAIILDVRNGQLHITKGEEILDEQERAVREKLDALHVEITESLHAGTESNESDSREITPYNPELIQVNTKPFSIPLIFDMIQNGDINLSPDFQRKFVWDTKQKCRLIESILLRIPLPIFYFAEVSNDGKFTVVDGQQRLKAISEFMNNEFPLKGLEHLSECEGKYYSKKGKEIDGRFQRWYKQTQIMANVISASTPPPVKYDIFRRINTGGKPLNAQELRNCLAEPKVREILKKMVALPSFTTTIDNSVSDARMEAQELALRFIYFYRKYNENNKMETYSDKIETELDSIIESLNGETKGSRPFDVNRYVTYFDNAMQNAHHLLGKWAFRKCKIEHIQSSARKQMVNKALFVSWSVLLSHHDPQKISQLDKELLVKPLVEKITEDESFYRYLSVGTNGKANIQNVFRVASEIIKKYIVEESQ